MSCKPMHGCMNYILLLGAVVALIVWLLDLQLPMQSVPVTTDHVVSLNLLISARCTTLPVAEILLKVALNTKITPIHFYCKSNILSGRKECIECSR